MSTTIDDVPVANTPPGGYGDVMPEPVLAGCDEPLPADAPDLRGLWEVVSVSVDGDDVPDHHMVGHRQRVEQAGDRLVVTAGGVVHDMRCDGVLDHGVHDVGPDFETPIHVTATYEDGVHVLRPDGLPVEVTRRRDDEHTIWQYGPFFTARLARVGDVE